MSRMITLLFLLTLGCSDPGSVQEGTTQTDDVSAQADVGEDTVAATPTPDTSSAEDTGDDTEGAPEACEGAKAPPIIPAPQTTSVNGQEVIFWPSETPAGVLFFFHGTGGRPDFISNKLEMRYVVERALAEKFSVIALKAIGTQWSRDESCDSNPDFENFNALKALAIANGAMAESSPVFLMGYSNGGSMVERVSFCSAVRGVALIMIRGGDIGLEFDAFPPPPRIVWSPNRNDGTVSADRVIGTYNRYVEAGGQGGLLLVNEPAPLLPGHLTRIQGVDCDISTAVYNAYRRNGVIDDDGFLIENPRTDQSIWRQAIPEDFRQYNDRFGPLLHELYTNHYGVTGEFTDQIFDFWLSE